jgi:hypothetical protein
MFVDACAVIEAALDGSARRQIVAEVSASRHFRTALIRLRDSMRSNVWKAGATEFPLGRIVRGYDSLTRRDGFHVMHDWDGIADRVNEDTIPVDVLNYIAEQRGGGETDAAVLSILLDYYFLHVLALLSLRIWDEGDADVRFRRIGQLLDRLQGPDGSGQRFAANAETLLLLGTSHFEIDERGYDTLLAKVKTLDRQHRTNVALGHAASMGSHLRFGFEATYARDTVIMRNDNVTDYPWLSFSLATLIREYARMRADGVAGPVPSGVEGPDRDAISEAMLNGLSPDARAFVGGAPAASSPYETDRAEFRDLFRTHEQELLAEFERFRPSTATYSPLSFFFNFSHNVVKGAVVDALLRGKPWTLTLNDLLTGISIGANENAEKEALATTLMGYARANPHRIRGRLMPVIVYDPAAGRRAFSVTMQKLDEE